MPLLRRVGGSQNMNGNKKNVGNFAPAAGASTSGKIRLRRVPNKQQLINQNLQTLKENAAKKQFAQECYYQTKGTAVGRSPLKRQGKPPIQNRLGNTTGRLGTVNNRQKVFVNQNQLRNRVGQRNNMQNRPQNRNPRMQNRNNVTQGRNTIMQNRNNKFVRRYSVQQRLTNIKNSANNVNQGMQKIRLRRNQPIDYTVQVKNATQRKKKTLILDPILQAEIKAIQNRTPALAIRETPIVEQAFGCTSVTLNDRFTQLM